jgi:hypothetical protein
MKEAARKAGVSRSVAYLHFEDRDQLLNQAKTWIKNRLQNGVVLFDGDATLHERVLYTTRLVMQHPEVSKVMIMDALASGGTGPERSAVSIGTGAT